jgi:hypothetical protein
MALPVADALTHFEVQQRVQKRVLQNLCPLVDVLASRVATCGLGRVGTYLALQVTVWFWLD